MDKLVLELELKDSEDKSGIIRVDSPKEDLTDETVVEAMEALLETNVFTNKGKLFVKANGARIVTTSIKEFDIA